MKEYSVEELLAFIGEDDPYINVDNKDKIEVERFLYDMKIVPILDGEEGIWTPEYYIYYAYCLWKQDDPLSFKKFKKVFPKCKTFRSPNGYEDLKVIRGNLDCGYETSKEAKIYYVRSLLKEEERLVQWLRRKKAWRTRRNEIRKKTQDSKNTSSQK